MKISAILLFFTATLGCLACVEDLSPPEIWPNISPIYVGSEAIGQDSDTDPQYFDIQLENRGEDVLEIESVYIRGDQNCAFTFEGPDKMEMNKNGSSFMRGLYQPTMVAEDHISLEINSNSHINSPLIIPICGRGILPEAQEIPPPLNCNPPPPSQPDCTPEG